MRHRIGHIEMFEPQIARTIAHARIGKGRRRRAFQRIFKGSRRIGRAIDRARQARKHLHILELLRRIIGGRNDVETVDPAVLHHAALKPRLWGRAPSPCTEGR
jgi:hypothetical protein